MYKRQGFDKLCGTLVQYMDEVYEDKHLTFKVNARRARKKYPLDSMTINGEVGGVLLNAFPEMKVDVHKPDVMPVSYTHPSRVHSLLPVLNAAVRARWYSPSSLSSVRCVMSRPCLLYTSRCV